MSTPTLVQQFYERIWNAGEEGAAAALEPARARGGVTTDSCTPDISMTRNLSVLAIPSLDLVDVDHVKVSQTVDRAQVS